MNSNEGEFLIRSKSDIKVSDDRIMAIRGKLISGDKAKPDSGYLISEYEDEIIRQCNPKLYQRVIMKPKKQEAKTKETGRNLNDIPDFQEKYSFSFD